MRALLRRPVLAVVAALVWLLGVELGPGLHIARHGELGHHHHGASEALACASHQDGVAVDPHRYHAEHGEGDHAVEEHEHAAVDHHDHEHAAVDRHDHEHAAVDHHDHEHDHDHDVEPEPESADRIASVSVDFSLVAPPATPVVHEPGAVPHGAGSLAHRDLVPLTPPLVLPPILSAPWRPLVVAHVRCIAPSERTPETLRARGPPSGGQPTLEPLSLV